MNFFSAIKVKKPLLTAKHMKRRLAWAKKYQNWTTDDWRRVVFSDETKVNVWGSDGCTVGEKIRATFWQNRLFSLYQKVHAHYQLGTPMIYFRGHVS